MTISAKVLADSISPEGIRLTTMQITMHRFVLAEFNTHRVFSRSFRSSRAVPVKKLLEEVRTNPAMPVHWGSNKPGMQAGAQLTGDALSEVIDTWRVGAADAADIAESMMQSGLHKQVANRVLEPFLYVHGVVTATEWDNFFKLRCHPDAQPEMRVLAEAMRDAMAASTPKLLQPGECHLPYITVADQDALSNRPESFGRQVFDLALTSAARCARVSYKPFDGEGSIEKDLELADKLIKSGHWSPFEHSAQCGLGHSDRCRNFRGWRQHRALISG